MISKISENILNNLNESAKDSRIKALYKDGMGMWTLDLADGYETESGDNYIQEKTKSECLKMLNNIVHKINESVQGLETYTKAEIKDIVKSYIYNKLIVDNDYNKDDAEIIDINIIGSRHRFQAKKDSDLDVVVEFKDTGNNREDSLFNALNSEDDPLYIEGVRVDINPILASKTGNMKEFMKKSKEYDKEKLSESSNRNKLIKDIQNGKIGQDLVKQELSKTKNANMNDIYAKVADKLIKNKQVSVKPKSEFNIWKQDIDNMSKEQLKNYISKLYKQYKRFDDSKDTNIPPDKYKELLRKIDYIEKKLGYEQYRTGLKLH